MAKRLQNSRYQQ